MAKNAGEVKTEMQEVPSVESKSYLFPNIISTDNTIFESLYNYNQVFYIFACLEPIELKKTLVDKELQQWSAQTGKFLNLSPSYTA